MAKIISKRDTAYWKRLLWGNIVGVVDSYGAVHSVFTKDEIEHHDHHFPSITHCRWRWNHRESIYWCIGSDKPTEEEYAFIQMHLTKKYGLEWWENGHHDIQHLMKKAGHE